MRWNLFNSGADKAGTEAAESRTRMATETLYNFHDELALEIENTWTRYLAAKEQKKYYEEAIGYNTATRDAYLEQFKLAKEACSTCLMRKASFSTRPRSTRQPMATWL